MRIYQTKSLRLSGTRYKEVYDSAFGLYKSIQKQSKRRPYVRSAYFKRQKVFLGLFWAHLEGKNWRDRVRRMRYFPNAIEVVRHSHMDPFSVDNPNEKSEILHRFLATTKEGHNFTVQIKEDKRTGQKWLLSIFPDK